MNVLFLTHRLPYAPNRGDRVRAYHLLRAMKAFANVHLVSLVHDADEESHAGDLNTLTSTVDVVRVPRAWNLVKGAARLPTSRPLTHSLLDGPSLGRTIRRIVDTHAPDVVLAYCSGMARLALEPPLARVPMVLDMVDVDSEKWTALARGSRVPKSWIYRREARTLATFEARAARAAVVTLVTTERERESLLRLAPDSRVEVVGNGVDVSGLAPQGPPSDAPVVVFVGVMNYEPNVDAAIWLASEIWPLVRRARPEATLKLVGASPAAAVRRLHNPATGIEVTGAVPDVRPFLWSAAVAVAPVRTARGIQNKVLEAIATRTPVVATMDVASALPSSVARACSTANSAEGFAREILRLLALPPAERRGEVTTDLVALDWTTTLAGLEPLLRSAAGSGIEQLP